MNKISFIILLSAVLFLNCSTKPSTKAPQRATTQIEWVTDTEHDFGNVNVKDTMRHDFVFKNIGKIAFVIDSIIPSCGCTRANYIKRPVLPGKTDTIHVTYDGNGFLPGSFIKTCDIYSNTDTVYQLRIHGYYYEEE